MTPLQQTHADLLHAQYQQQRLCGFERKFLADPKEPPFTFRVLRGHMAIQETEIRRCQSLLVNSTAANDEPVPGEAA